MWRARCTCPGAALARDQQDRAEELRRGVAVVVAELQSSGGWDAEEVERRLSEVFQQKGQTIPSSLTGLSQLVVAANARRGTRIPRMLWMAARGIAGAVDWAWAPSAGADEQTEHNRAQARSGFRTIGVMAVVATTVTVVASRSSGWPRRLWTAAAAAIWLASGWAGVLVIGATTVSRVARRAQGPLASE
jgi:hypothetical protein